MQMCSFLLKFKMGTVELKGWGTNPTWHERLKQGYYDLQELWKDKD